MDRDDLPAALSDAFALGACLGRGATGVVYAAVRRQDGRAGAIKVWRAPHPALLALEARVAAETALRHPGLVRVFTCDQLPLGDCGSGGSHPPSSLGVCFMEALDGQPLAATLAASAYGALPWRHAAEIALDVARGLATLHAAGLIHRDIKPTNIRVASRGAVVMDMGTLAESGKDVALRGVGTTHYMAPEQAVAARLTPAVDIYALGCTLFELLTGSPPFAGTGLQLLVEHAERPLPSANLPRLVPASLRRLLEACCAKTAEDRPTATAVAHALATLLRQGRAARNFHSSPASLALVHRLGRSVRSVAIVATATLLIAMFDPQPSRASDHAAPRSWMHELAGALAPPRHALLAAAPYAIDLRAAGNRLTLAITDAEGAPPRLREVTVRLHDPDAGSLIFTAQPIGPGYWQITAPHALLDTRATIYVADGDVMLETQL